MIKIRQETPGDYDNVYKVIKEAFQTAEHSDKTEQDLAVRLRKSKAFIPELSLVAEKGGEIVGHIMFTEGTLGDLRAVGLAPLSISPACQKQGVGTFLMDEGHKIARDMGYEFSIVLGSEHYYPRVGYVPASKFGITSSFDVPENNFMALNLQGKEGYVGAVFEYAKEFFDA